ncbi:MAG: potassium channel family protein [Brachybacterium sp.]|uniref:potassium channel family protein n=1 Tax=Brachybacterium sp. AOP35-5H-19 TaxID=3457685 RepID=UPI003FB6DB4C
MALVAGYSILFQVLMAREHESHSWASALYWTITTMSTLGYGDITFTSDLGRLFSMLVLFSGVLLFVVLLPFSVVQFIVAPWMDRHEAARVPRKVPPEVSGHIILVGHDVVTQALVARAKRSGKPTVVLVDDPSHAGRLHEDGYRVMVGALDSPETYRRARVEQAAMVASTQADTTNTNVAFTVRGVDSRVTIAVTAEKEASVDVLELAGADHVLQLAPTLGRELARRILGTTGRPHVIGSFGQTQIAEAAARGTPLVGLNLAEARQQMKSRVRILATMRLGKLRPLASAEKIDDKTTVILAASEQDLKAYETRFCDQQEPESSVLILGGGRVGRAAAEEFHRMGVPFTIVETVPGRVPSHLNAVQGDAADLDVLRSAGLDEASAALVTTHDDDLNVYLTLYCRRLRPDMQVVTRATYERNVATQYRAGADSVLSYATIGATSLWNRFGPDHRVVIAEGNELFAVPMPTSLVGRPTSDPRVHEETGCHIVAVTDAERTLLPHTERIPSGIGNKLVLLGDRHAERAFRREYLNQKVSRPR